MYIYYIPLLYTIIYRLLCVSILVVNIVIFRQYKEKEAAYLCNWPRCETRWRPHTLHRRHRETWHLHVSAALAWRIPDSWRNLWNSCLCCWGTSRCQVAPMLSFQPAKMWYFKIPTNLSFQPEKVSHLSFQSAVLKSKMQECNISKSKKTSNYKTLKKKTIQEKKLQFQILDVWNFWKKKLTL